MERRAIGRDWRLSLRMTLVMVLLVAAYVGIGAALVALYEVEPSWGLYIGLLSAAVLATVVVHFVKAGDMLLRSAGASDQPTPLLEKVSERLGRLAALAEIPTPRCALAKTSDAKAFAVGVSKKQAIVVVTTGLCKLLDGDELDAVLAHELTHIANRDSAVMTLASVPRSIGAALVGQNSGGAFYLWFFIWPFGLIPLAFGTLLTLALSRYREYAADRGAALITGRPETVMSALSKLGKATPTGDLRQVTALCTVKAVRHQRELLMDHPPLAKRLAQLSEMERRIGEPATHLIARV